MALLNINDLLQQYALRSGILSPDGQMAQPQQQKSPGILNSPAFAQALANAAQGVALANERGYGLGSALSLGAGAFGNTIQAERDRQEQAQKEATATQLAAIKDIIGLRTQQEELALRMQAASLARRAQQDALDSRAQERAQAEARKQAVYASGDPNLIKAYEMFGDDAAQKIFIDGQTPKERKIINVDGIPYYEDTKQPVVPITGATSALPKLTEGQTTKKNLAEEALANYTIANQSLFDENGNVKQGSIGPIDSLYGEGRTSDQAIRRVIQNTLYMKTGASAPDAEVEKNLKMYKPSIFDNKEQIQNKMNSLKQFIDSNIPQGYEGQAAQAAGALAKKPDATAGWNIERVQ